MLWGFCRDLFAPCAADRIQPALLAESGSKLTLPLALQAQKAHVLLHVMMIRGPLVHETHACEVWSQRSMRHVLKPVASLPQVAGCAAAVPTDAAEMFRDLDSLGLIASKHHIDLY